jgi:hypothetical protein
MESLACDEWSRRLTPAHRNPKRNCACRRVCHYERSTTPPGEAFAKTVPSWIGSHWVIRSLIDNSWPRCAEAPKGTSKCGWIGHGSAP